MPIAGQPGWKPNQTWSTSIDVTLPSLRKHWDWQNGASHTYRLTVWKQSIVTILTKKLDILPVGSWMKIQRGQSPRIFFFLKETNYELGSCSIARSLSRSTGSNQLVDRSWAPGTSFSPCFFLNFIFKLSLHQWKVFRWHVKGSYTAPSPQLFWNYRFIFFFLVDYIYHANLCIIYMLYNTFPANLFNNPESNSAI